MKRNRNKWQWWHIHQSSSSRIEMGKLSPSLLCLFPSGSQHFLPCDNSILVLLSFFLYFILNWNFSKAKKESPSSLQEEEFSLNSTFEQKDLQEISARFFHIFFKSQIVHRIPCKIPSREFVKLSPPIVHFGRNLWMFNEVKLISWSYPGW